MTVDPRVVPIVSIVGRAGSGKTTFLVKLISELSARGVRVATAKHVVHAHETDVVGKDSWRHAEAGSVVAMVSSPDKLSFVQKVQRELTLDELARIAFDAGSDVLLTEGYKRDGINRVEVLRRGADSTDLVSAADALLALVTDMPEAAPAGALVFGLDDARGVADLVQSRILGTKAGD